MGALNCYYILVWWIFFIPLLDAEICEFYEKVMDWDWNNWNTSAIKKKYSRIRYKIQRSSFYCYSNQYCCWKDCCYKYKTESYEDDEDKTKLSTDSVWGIIIGVTVGCCLFLACCVQLCKSGHTAQTTIPMTVARSDDGTVIVRQRNSEEPNASASMPLFPDGQNTVQHSRSPLDDNSCSERAVPGNQSDLGPMSSPNEYNNRSSHTTDYTLPPPSYEYVMSHDFPGSGSQHLNKQTD
ncbi:uncharacterized protein LOC133187393 [Saccostrea echinata]|uniref:uncharacterized protein LOC133187393 n=1 Tax=Saccostrea echinata TaxID=191078 RepID=UPI002A80D4C6|nr:uncharacterized protein LOC133187393 [Saccostrea echinata]